MSQNSWLPLTEYSSKYKVSVSTLRRRIKAKTAEYSFEDGKYLLRDLPLRQHKKQEQSQNLDSPAAPPQKIQAGEKDFDSATSSNRTIQQELPPIPPIGEKLETTMTDMKSSPILSTANQLLNEIKKAYSLILSEKEEQILILKEEIANMKTLVQVLEENNDRLRQQLSQKLMTEKATKEIKEKSPNTPAPSFTNEWIANIDN